MALEDLPLKLPDGTTFTFTDLAEAHNEPLFARHEASHAVAAWIVGIPIVRMEMKDIQNSAINAAETVTGTGVVLSELEKKPLGELRVYGSNQAFISLAGPHGSGESKKENPLCQFHTKDHFDQAKKKLINIARMSEGEAETEALLLLEVVKWITTLPRFQNAVTQLSAQLIKHRKLSGEQAAAVISQEWVA
jgi:hypothetical protein